MLPGAGQDRDTGSLQGFSAWTSRQRSCKRACERVSKQWSCNQEVPSSLDEVTCDVAVALNYDANWG